MGIIGYENVAGDKHIIANLDSTHRDNMNAIIQLHIVTEDKSLILGAIQRIGLYPAISSHTQSLPKINIFLTE